MKINNSIIARYEGILFEQGVDIKCPEQIISYMGDKIDRCKFRIKQLESENRARKLVKTDGLVPIEAKPMKCTIKTIIETSMTKFDTAVNKYLAEGWELKDTHIETMYQGAARTYNFYAMLMKYIERDEDNEDKT